MKYNPEIHNRKSARLKEYDYSAEAMYFITICTKNRENLLSKIIDVGVDAHIDPNRKYMQNVGVDAHIDPNRKYMQNVGVDAHIDPNVKLKQIQKNVLHENIKIQLKDYGKIVQKYINNINVKYENINVGSYVIMPDHVHMIICINAGSMWASTPTDKKITIPKIVRTLKILITKEIGYPIWQRNYYEHIIRNEKEYYKISEYIEQNPFRWIQKNVGVDAHIDPNRKYRIENICKM